jgi:hypothetical protein
MCGCSSSDRTLHDCKEDDECSSPEASTIVISVRRLSFAVLILFVLSHMCYILQCIVARDRGDHEGYRLRRYQLSVEKYATIPILAKPTVRESSSKKHRDVLRYDDILGAFVISQRQSIESFQTGGRTSVRHEQTNFIRTISPTAFFNDDDDDDVFLISISL